MAKWTPQSIQALQELYAPGDPESEFAKTRANQTIADDPEGLWEDRMSGGGGSQWAPYMRVLQARGVTRFGPSAPVRGLQRAITTPSLYDDPRWKSSWGGAQSNWGTPQLS